MATTRPTTDGGRDVTIGIYMRVSKGSQDTASQEPDLKRWAAGQTEPVSWFTDKQTGKTMDRPGFNKLMRAVQELSLIKI